MENGYIIYQDAADAFDAFHQYGGIRFAAELTDGTGFAAFDRLLENMQDEENRVFLTQEPLPGHRDTWPDWYKKAAPKRGIGTGMEHFALVPMAFEEYLHAQESVTGCARVIEVGADEPVLMVESNGPIGTGITSWAVTRFLDKRLAIIGNGSMV